METTISNMIINRNVMIIVYVMEKYSFVILINKKEQFD